MGCVFCPMRQHQFCPLCVRKLITHLTQYNDEVSLGAINDFNLAECVPLDGFATFAQIAEKSGISERLAERFLRHAMGNHIFTEDPAGHVRHTALSRLLATDTYLRDAVAMMGKDLKIAGMRVTDAVTKFGDSEEPTEAAFTLAYEPGVSLFDYMAKHSEKATRYGRSMKFFGSFESWDPKHLVNGYPWDLVDRSGAVLVDVGGGHGAMPIALASATQNLKFIVQDFEDTIRQGREALPEHLKSRVEFMPHDFFTEQPIKGADIYFMRWILHCWSDKYAIRILKGLIPAMKDGCKLILVDWLLKDGPETRLTEKYPR